MIPNQSNKDKISMKNTLVEFNNWLDTDDGKGCLTTSCEISEPVLYNRLRQAFYAGKEVNNFDKMKEAIETQLQIIEALISNKRIVNLDESIAYYKQLLESLK